MPSTSPFPARSSSGRAGPPSWPGSLPSLGSRVLLCTGSDPSRHLHLLGDVEPVAVVRVTREPLVDDARSALDEARAAGADTVVAIGGGSVLDLAKAVAVLLGNGTDPLDHLEVVGRGLPIERPAVPYVAVPTTAGTGAEATANAVLGCAGARPQGEHPQPAHAGGRRARRSAADAAVPARRDGEQRAGRADAVSGALRLAEGQPGHRRRRGRRAAARCPVAPPCL